jgi:transcriptional regulator with XRE-family HTH domain
MGAEARKNTTPRTLRTEYGLSRPAFARMLGTSEAAIASWEQGAATLDAATLDRVGRVEGILGGLARVMRPAFIPVWLEQPNEACKEAGARTPLDLLARGDFQAVEAMIFYLESGTPA